MERLSRIVGHVQAPGAQAGPLTAESTSSSTSSAVKICYTHTDEAPGLASYSLLPVLRAFCNLGKVTMIQKDITLAGRILAQFPDYLKAEQRCEDELEEMGKMAKTKTANMVKLPNISASVPQLCAAIKELQQKGFALPDYPERPQTDKEKDVRSRYAKVLGSVVNPVLREGNSDRRVARPVKAYAAANPHKVGPWAADSKSHVAHMDGHDWFANEQSAVMPKSCTVRIELLHGGKTTVLKAKTALQQGEVIDASALHVQPLREFYEQQLQATEKDTLFSLHLKATMMKVSDPIIFGHCVEVFYKSAWEKHAKLLQELGVNARNGVGDLYAKIKGHPKQAEVEADFAACYKERPQLAYVDGRKGITNLHVPSDVIVDASMASAVRDSGRMWDKEDVMCDTKFVIPDRCYASIYQAIIEDCKQHGALDVQTMGHSANVGLMAQKAEEYGSHDKTFEIPEDGKVQVVDGETGAVVFSHEVSRGDIWRMCQTKDAPLQDWVKLAVTRARNSDSPVIFWLSEERAHDRNIIEKVHAYLKNHDTNGLHIKVLDPAEAMRETLRRLREGKDTISATGNVLRDYLTDLFPVLELGTSAKMLSIVPLLAGGSMFETGAGGSAPKHVQQFVKEGHLRWDSLGEFLAMAVSLEDLGQKTGNRDADILSITLNEAIGDVLDNGKSPKRQVRQLDNRGSHFYLALYWAKALAKQTDSPSLASFIAPVADQLASSEEQILGEFMKAEGKPVHLGGYFLPDPALALQAMRPSPTFNRIIDALLAASG